MKPRIRSSLVLISAFADPAVSSRVRVKKGSHSESSRWIWCVGILGLGFVQARPRKLRIRKEGIWDLSIPGASVTTGKMIAYYAKVVKGDVREVRTSCAVSHSVYTLYCRLQVIIHMNMPIRRERHFPGDLSPVCSGHGRSLRASVYH